MAGLERLVPTASVLDLNHVGAEAARVYGDITRLVQSHEEAVEVHELRNQIESIRSVIQAIAPLVSEAPKLSDYLPDVLGITCWQLGEISELIHKYGNSGRNRVSKIKWALRDKAAFSRLSQTLDSCTSTLGIMLQIANKKQASQQASVTEAAPEITIAVMGQTGSGKSSLIRKITGREDVSVGHALKSETQSVQAYSITVEGRLLTLVDTPGFDDTLRLDVDVLRDVASWMAERYQSGTLLSGIIYLFPITSVRMSGSSITGLDVFAKLVGIDSFQNISLVTTMWDLLPDQSVGYARERDLKENFWRPFIEKGSITARSFGDRQSALNVISRAAFDQRRAMSPGMFGAPLTIQKEIVEKQKPLEETSAGQELAIRLNEIERQHQEQLRRLRMENKDEKALMQAQIDAIREEQAKLKISHTQGDNREHKSLTNIKTTIHVRLTAEELLQLDPPPSYEEATATRRLIADLPAAHFFAATARSARELTMFALTPITELKDMLLPWSCGDALCGDYFERTPGSLQVFAAQLGGRIVSGPAAYAGYSNTPSSLPATPPSAHLRQQAVEEGESSQSGSSRTSTGAQQSDNIASSTAIGSRRTAATAASIQPGASKWLELCIRSGPDTHILGEIDIEGWQTDQSVFRRYGKSRVPNGGIFVQMRKDKLVNPDGDPATVGIMKPAVPTGEEAIQYKYTFDPIPMDEPPMDPRTFNHYFHKPHEADTSATWIERFPKLEDASLYWNGEKLTKGWGIEITEERNWILFLCVTLVGLLISGIVAGLSAHFLHNVSAGLAIGSWLSSITGQENDVMQNGQEPRS
ncbi:MAG: hypothetical protein M1820_005913 [Bogoriella megaspora]|nr:MAG: hypothetical protein M1820_005913 [Bogoriella megaspora]